MPEPPARAVDGATLLAHCRSADPAEQEGAFRALAVVLQHSLARRVAGRPELYPLAAEAVQEALEAIWRQLREGQGPADPDHFAGWAVVIAANKLREAQRRQEGRARLQPGKRVAASRQLSLEAPPPGQERPFAETLAAPDAPPAAVEQHLAREALLAALLHSPALSPQARQVLVLGFLEGWDDEQLAAELGTSRGNVHVIRSRALARLRGDAALMARLRSWLGVGA